MATQATSMSRRVRFKFPPPFAGTLVAKGPHRAPW
jgi:hypothetical protein